MANEERPKAQPAQATETRPLDPPNEIAEGAVEEEPEVKPSRLEQLVARLRRPSDQPREVKTTERTRALVILVVTSVACLFLFIGLFTTDSATSRRERRTKPNLGRPEQTAGAPESAGRSAVPQLSASQQPNEDTGELSEKDLLATMRNRGAFPPTQPPPPPPVVPTKPKALASVNFEDPALIEAYRRQGISPPPQRTEVSNWNPPAPEKPVSLPPANPTDALRKSSIVFVRATYAQNDQRPTPLPVVEQKAASLLPPGTALVARLQHAVSSAAKVPVIAVVEYNYEHDGELIVPAGSKAYGELSQATPQGWVALKFTALEFPNGERENINGSAVSMERTPLRGDVNGKNSGKKFLTRALTGVGTIAAYAVGGRGLGSSGIDSSILLRERFASNIALGGEQELAQLAYQQNIVVTVPANTRFYLVLHEAGVTRNAAMPGPAPAQTTKAEVSAQELREMIQLRNEMREMNRLMTQSLQGANAAQAPSKEDR